MDNTYKGGTQKCVACLQVNILKKLEKYLCWLDFIDSVHKKIVQSKSN
jgi:hypothetical protein